MAHQVSNAINFETIQDEYRYKHCDQFAKRDWCGVQKATEYNSNKETMMIWYQGLHKCTSKPGHKSKEQEYQGKEALKTVMHKFPGLSRNAHARAGAHQAMEDGNPELADYILETYQDTQIFNSAKKEMYMNMAGKERHSTDAVATVKKTQDRFDQLNIYEVNDCKMNNQPSYVFKPSKSMAKIALLMDQDHEEKTPFQDVVAFMDGLHSHVKDYLTLTLWLHNPVICHMQHITYMDCESENTTNIATF